MERLQTIGFAGLVVQGDGKSLKKWLKHLVHSKYRRRHEQARDELYAAQQYVDRLHANAGAGYLTEDFRDAYAVVADKAEAYRVAVLELQAKAEEKCSRFSIKVLDKQNPLR